MRKILENKRGVVGLTTGKKVITILMVMGILAFAVIIALQELNSTSVATTETTNIVNNITGGVETFFSNAGTWFALLAIVVLILIVVLVVKAVDRKGSGGL